MKLMLGGGVGNGPAGMKLGGGVGNGPAGMKLGGGVGNGPAGIAFAVQAVTTTSKRMRTLKIFNVLVHMGNSFPAEAIRPNFAIEEYPKRVMESTTKVALRKIFHLSNKLEVTLVIKTSVT
jgi:hypothetical protein